MRVLDWMESAFFQNLVPILLMRRICATCSFVPKCPNCTHSRTLLPASRSSIVFAQGPASAVLVLLVPGCVDSLSLAYFCRLSKFVITNTSHFLLTQFHWSWRKSQARCFQDIAGHDHSDNATCKGKSLSATTCTSLAEQLDRRPLR